MDTVLTTISRYSMLAPGDRVAVAVSGGPDSVCLLHVLLDLAPRLSFSVAGIAHLNHQLRGEESDEDERFVGGLAARHGISFWCERSAVAAHEGNLEQNARRARHDFFARVLRDGVADRVATGHTASDQAETVLFRLLRGSGLSGLAGILPVTREGLIRPLLGVSREDVLAYLHERDLEWREDQSNRDVRFARNRIRHELLPSLASDWNPEIGPALAHLADLAYEEERRWEPQIDALVAELVSGDAQGMEIEAAKLAALPRAAARRLVRRLLRSLTAAAPSYGAVEQILDLASRPQGHGKVQLAGTTVVRSLDWLRLVPAGKPVAFPPLKISVPGCYEWAGRVISLDVRESQCSRDGCVSLRLCGGRVPTPLELRGWKAGDHYRPFGQSRDHKIKELFQEARIPCWRRHSWPIIACGSTILWAQAFGPAAEFAAESESGPVLHIWERPLPESPLPQEKRLGSEPRQGLSTSVEYKWRTHEF